LTGEKQGKFVKLKGKSKEELEAEAEERQVKENVQQFAARILTFRLID
jgi:hypothetical protein